MYFAQSFVPTWKYCFALLHNRHKVGRASLRLGCGAHFERSAGVFADRGDLANQLPIAPPHKTTGRHTLTLQTNQLNKQSNQPHPNSSLKTALFKERLASGETLDDLLPEAFAAIREAADRVIGLRPYPVQLIGGIILHQGRIAEMKTGEGKTLVATMPAYLNALSGKGVHIVTVNDYLARRDSEEMGRVYGFLGLTTGLVLHDQKRDEKQKAYNCDITYGTNNEFGRLVYGSYTLVEIDGDVLTATAYLADGRIIDVFTIDKTKDLITPYALAPTYDWTKMTFKGQMLELIAREFYAEKKDGIWYAPFGVIIQYIGGKVIKEKE